MVDWGGLGGIPTALQDKRLLQPGGRLGTLYWKELAERWGAGENGIDDLPPGDASLPINDHLVQALEQAQLLNPAKRTMEPLVSFLQHCPKLNVRELRGLLKAASKLKLVSKMNQQNVLVECMKYIVRTGVAKESEQEVEAMKDIFDNALAHQWTRLKSKGVSHLTWLSSHLELVAQGTNEQLT